MINGLKPSFESLSDSQITKLLDEVNKQLSDGKLSVENYSLKTALLNEEQSRLGQGTLALSQSTATLANSEAQASAEIAKHIQARGDEKETIEANLVAKQKELAAAEANVQLKIAERNESQRQLDVDIALAGGIDFVSEGKRKEFQARQLVINSKNQEIIQGLEIVSQTSKEATSLSTLTGNTQTYLRALEKMIDAEGKRLQAQSTIIDSSIKRVEAERNVAIASNDTATAIAKQQEIDSLNVQQAQKNLQIENNRLDVLSTRYTATLNQALADGELTEAEQAQIGALEEQIATQEGAVEAAGANVEASEANAEANKKQAESSEKSAEANEKVSKTYTLMESGAEKAAKQVGALSQGALDMVNALSTGLPQANLSVGETTESISKLEQHLTMVNEIIKYNKSVVGSLPDAYSKVVDATNQTWKAFDEEAIRAEKLTLSLEKMAETGIISVGQLNSAVQQSKSGFTVLDEARLDNLKAAIDKVKEKMKQLADETRDAKQSLEELNEEILQEKGLTEQAEKMALINQKTQQLAELEDKLAKAREESNKDLVEIYEEQKKKLDELYRLKEKNLIKDQERRKQEEAASATSNNSQSSSSALSPVKSTVVLQFQNPSGTSRANATVPDEATAQRVVEILKQAGGSLAG